MIEKLWKRKWIKTAVAIVATFVAVNTATYLWYAESLMPREGIGHLADYALLDECDYVVLNREMWSCLSESQRAVLLAELSRPGRAVYYTLAEVPESALHYRSVSGEENGREEVPSNDDSLAQDPAAGNEGGPETARELAGLKGGVGVSWWLQAQGPFWMKCKSSLWVSELGAEASSDVYIWLVAWWVRVYNVYHVMA
ncbi:MAG: hypothetical protein HQ582_15735 [Planctomycetes bacterium]|nr:hypothetical protein [Planctomycetota bacterium]